MRAATQVAPKALLIQFALFVCLFVIRITRISFFALCFSYALYFARCCSNRELLLLLQVVIRFQGLENNSTAVES